MKGFLLGHTLLRACLNPRDGLQAFIYLFFLSIPKIRPFSHLFFPVLSCHNLAKQHIVYGFYRLPPIPQ